MPRRREFTRQQKEDIVVRATDAQGTIRCEKCGLAVKRGSYEIDHIIAEGLRPAADKKAKLTIAEGQLLGKACCHRGDDGKTNQDVAKIAKAKRQASKHVGITRPAGKLKSRGFPVPDNPKPQGKPPLAPRRLYRTMGG